MKGLIYKDFLCLRKTLKTSAVVIFGVLLMSVLFLISTRYGNLAESIDLVITKEAENALKIEDVLGPALYCILIVPIGFVGDVATCFKEDARVGFGKTLSGMSLTHQQIVGSRYLTTLIYLMVGMAASLFTAGVLSIVPSGFEANNYVPVVITIGAGFGIYMSLVLFLTYLLGANRADLINIGFLIAVLAGCMWFFGFRSQNLSEAEMDWLMKAWMDKITHFLQGGYLFLIPTAVVMMCLSYAGSVEVLRRRRRVL